LPFSVNNTITAWHWYACIQRHPPVHWSISRWTWVSGSIPWEDWHRDASISTQKRGIHLQQGPKGQKLRTKGPKWSGVLAEGVVSQQPVIFSLQATMLLNLNLKY